MAKYYTQITLKDTIVFKANSEKELAEIISDNEEQIAEQLKNQGILNYEIVTVEDEE